LTASSRHTPGSPSTPYSTVRARRQGAQRGGGGRVLDGRGGECQGVRRRGGHGRFPRASIAWPRGSCGAGYDGGEAPLGERGPQEEDPAQQH
jgi:hypothetical protein